MKQHPKNNYTVYVDETGNFSFKKNESFIGGWICRSEEKNKIERIIKKSVGRFNNHLKLTCLQNDSLQYPSHLHFMPLHLKHLRTGKDNFISVDPDNIGMFFFDLFTSLKNISLQVFRSTGKPAFFPNEQASYINILRNTLLQLIDQPKLFTQNSKIDIVIAHRRNAYLYGEEGILDWRGYEKYIINGLVNELKGAFVGIKPAINIFFEDARKEPGLIIADFFCGALRWTKENYLEEFNTIKKFPFANGYKLVGSRMVQRIQYLEEIDTPSAAVQCSDVLSGDPANKELTILLKSILQKMNSADISRFCNSIINLFQDRLVDDPDRYSHLPAMAGLIKVLQPMFPVDYSSMNQEQMQLMVAMLLNKIRIISHKGGTGSGQVEELMSFLDEHCEAAFDNQMQVMQYRIDAILMGVQIQAFNIFKFDDVEDLLKEIRERYHALFKNELNSNHCKDKNFASLEGTLGQMYGFLYDLDKDGDYFEMALLHFENDINACIERSAAWEQAMGFLTTLYWKKGEFDKAAGNFLKESGASADSLEKITDLTALNLFQDRHKPFIRLHRLYLCALSAENGNPVNGLDNLKKEFLTDKRISSYPYFLSVKWLAILLLQNGKDQDGLDILNAAISKDDSIIINTATITAIRIPLAILRHYAAKKLGKRSAFSCESEVNRLGKQQPTIKTALIKLGIKKYYNNENNWSLYDIGTLLPFYYS
ncbi:MAG: DUF3800 domain-containing protein [Deltaproteobacteria bacterium]|nr:DUF3800 domain-containing protein [Deltaproteobacteria bacterium]